ncbi:MAG: hypothetical protein D6B28_10725 [Gammaproteobacteria bacterium]|nr:MAG: hypothetical protein D6B28_10725 [Gammaproteobacteria bacterium]
MNNKNLGLQSLAVVALAFSTTTFALSPPVCDEITATNAQHIENGLAEACNFFSVCSTGDKQVIGYSWTSSSTETTLYTDGSGAGYKIQPEQCKVVDPRSCPTTEDTLAALKESGLAEDCGTYSICSTGDNKTLGYSWLAKYSKVKVYKGTDDLGYTTDPKNCGQIEPFADLAVTAKSDKYNVKPGEIVTISIDLNNIGNTDSNDTATINAYVAMIDGCSETDCAPSGELTILEVNSSDANCDADGYSLSCVAGPIASGDSVSVNVTAQAAGDGPVMLDIYTAAEDDADTSNNNTYLNFEVKDIVIEDDITYIEPAINIISGSELPNTENLAFTSDGSLYVAQANYGGSIYRISKDANGKYKAHSFVQGPDNCRFSGMTATDMTLYAACQTQSSGTYLMKIELLDDILDIQSKKLDIEHGLANGMAVGPNGSIYISDSSSVVTTIIKVTITNPETFEFTAEPWLDKEYAINMPNGIQIEGDLMYFADRYKIRTIKIEADAPGAIEDFYTTDNSMLIDDFAITPTHLAIAEINYMSAVMNGAGVGGHTIILDKNNGKQLQKIAATQKYQPSSVIYDNEGVFAKDALFVTDYFLGGLYLIEADQLVFADN